MPKPVICIGAALVDELFHATGELLLSTTTDATVTKTAGGVSRNIAHQLALLGVPVQLVSAFGNDSDGDWLKQVSKDAGVKLDANLYQPPNNDILCLKRVDNYHNVCQLTDNS